MKLTIDLKPNARQTQLVSWDGSVLKLKLTAPPIEGKANRALIDFLSNLLDLAPSTINIIQGQTSRRKVIEAPITKEHLEKNIAEWFG